MVKYFNLNRKVADSSFDPIADTFSIEVNYPIDGAADVPLLKEHIDEHLRSEGYVPEEEFKVNILRDESLVYRTYKANRDSANVGKVKDMLTGKKIKRCDVKPVGWNLDWRMPHSIDIGLPTERYHKVLTSTLEGLGYFQVI